MLACQDHPVAIRSPASPTTRSRVLGGLRSLSGLIEPIPDELSRRVRWENLRRLRLVAPVAAVVSALHLVVFAFLETTSAEAATWRTGILVAHGVLLAASLAVPVIARRIETAYRTEVGASLVSGIALLVVLGLGIAIAVLDQLVTSSITPLLIANAIAGLILVLSPRVTLIAYPVGVVAFALVLPLTQADPSVLTSNRVNGLTAGAIGLGLALLRWRTKVRDHALMRRIELQQLELEERNAELARMAAHDPLTGLLNRRQFALQFDQEIERHRREERRCSLLLLDLDHFKAVNDAHGHPVGDALLRATAELVAGRLRASDILARWGGEEFLVLLPGTGREGAAAVAEELRATVRAAALDVGLPEPVGVTVSVGVAEVALDHAEPLVDAYRRADAALYGAKGSGRDRVGVDAGA